MGVDLKIQSLLAVALPEDKAIMILGSSSSNEWENIGYCVDIK